MIWAVKEKDVKKFDKDRGRRPSYIDKKPEIYIQNYPPKSGNRFLDKYFIEEIGFQTPDPNKHPVATLVGFVQDGHTSHRYLSLKKSQIIKLLEKNNHKRYTT